MLKRVFILLFFISFVAPVCLAQPFVDPAIYASLNVSDNVNVIVKYNSGVNITEENEQEYFQYYQNRTVVKQDFGYIPETEIQIKNSGISALRPFFVARVNKIGLGKLVNDTRITQIYLDKIVHAFENETSNNSKDIERKRGYGSYYLLAFFILIIIVIVVIFFAKRRKTKTNNKHYRNCRVLLFFCLIFLFIPFGLAIEKTSNSIAFGGGSSNLKSSSSVNVFDDKNEEVLGKVLAPFNRTYKKGKYVESILYEKVKKDKWVKVIVRYEIAKSKKNFNSPSEEKEYFRNLTQSTFMYIPETEVRNIIHGFSQFFVAEITEQAIYELKKKIEELEARLVKLGG